MDITIDNMMLPELQTAEGRGLVDSLLAATPYLPTFRTPTEMRVSVLNAVAFPTPDAKYWQTVREQRSMYEGLLQQSFMYRRRSIDIQKQQRLLQQETDDLELQLLQLHLEELEYAQRSEMELARERFRELVEWERIKQELLPQLVYSVTDANEHQLTSYTQHWLHQVSMLTGSETVGEKQNALGQAVSGVTACIQAGVIDKVLNNFPKPFVQEVMGKLGFVEEEAPCMLV